MEEGSLEEVTYELVLKGEEGLSGSPVRERGQQCWVCVQVLRKDTFRAPAHVGACVGIVGMSWATALHAGVCIQDSQGEPCSCAHN